MVDNNFQPMDFGEVFANTFTVIKRTFSRSGVIVLLVLVVAGLMFAWSNMNYVDGLYKLFSKYVGVTDQKAQQEMGPQVLGLVPSFFLGICGCMLLILLGQTIATVASWEGVNGHPVETAPLLRRSVGKVFLYNLIQALLMGVVLVMLYVIVAIATFALGQGDSVALVANAVFALAFVALFLFTMFRVQEVDVDERGPFRGMTSAIALFRTNKWRATAPILAFGLAFGAVSVLLTVLMVGDTSTMMGMPSASGKDLEATVALLARARAAMNWSHLAVQAVVNAIALFFLFNLITVVYTDLRIRRGDYIRGEELEAWERDV